MGFLLGCARQYQAAKDSFVWVNSGVTYPNYYGKWLPEVLPLEGWSPCVLRVAVELLVCAYSCVEKSPNERCMHACAHACMRLDRRPCFYMCKVSCLQVLSGLCHRLPALRAPVPDLSFCCHHCWSSRQTYTRTCLRQLGASGCRTCIFSGDNTASPCLR